MDSGAKVESKESSDYFQAQGDGLFFNGFYFGHPIAHNLGMMKI